MGGAGGTTGRANGSFAMALLLATALLAGCGGSEPDAAAGGGGPTSTTAAPASPSTTPSTAYPSGPATLLQVPAAEDLGEAVGEPVYFRIPQPNLVGPAGPCGVEADAAPDLRVQLMDASQSRFLIDIALAEATPDEAADDFAAAGEVEACAWEAGGDLVRSAPVPDASAALAAGLPEAVEASVRAEVATDSGGREVTATRVVLRSGRQLLVLHAAGLSQEQALAMVPAAIVR